MQTGAEEIVDDWSPHRRQHLCEASLRLLAALGPEPQFPGDLAGIEALTRRVATGRPGEVMGFAVEPSGQLPRYTGDFLVWISPAADGCIRLRYECGYLESEAVVLRPDGRLDEFRTIAGFGVPDSELTEQACADREAIKRLAQENDAEELELDGRIDEEQRRFRTEHLLAVRAAPPQDGGGPIVSFIVLYDTGVIVHYLVPRPADEELETTDPWAEPLTEAMLPRIELSDGLGTVYRAVGWNEQGADAPFLRASQSFIPAVPAETGRLSVGFEDRSVEIELGAR